MAGFARLLANLVVMGGGVLSRAFVEAYKQALANGGQAAAGAAKGAVKNSGIAEMEARMILNVKPKATEAEIAEAHEKLMAMNDPAKGGSEYLQKKIIAARNALIAERSPPPPPPNSGASGGDAKASP